MATMIFSSSDVNGIVRSMQSKKRMALTQASSATVSQLLNVTKTGCGRNEYEVMNCVYEQWYTMGKLLDDIFQQIDTGVKLCFKLAKEAIAAEENSEQQQRILVDRLTVSDRCYALANRYIAGDKVFWEFKQNMLTIGSDPDKLQEVVDAIKANPNWGIPAFLLDENVPVPGNFIPEEESEELVPFDSAPVAQKQEIVTTKEEAKVNTNEVLESGQQAIFDVKKSTGIFSFLSKKVSAATDTVVSAATAVVTKVKAVAATVVNTVVNAAIAVKNSVSNLFGLVGSAFSNLFSSTTV